MARLCVFRLRMYTSVHSAARYASHKNSLIRDIHSFRILLQICAFLFMKFFTAYTGHDIIICIAGTSLNVRTIHTGCTFFRSIYFTLLYSVLTRGIRLLLNHSDLGLGRYRIRLYIDHVPALLVV